MDDMVSGSKIDDMHTSYVCSLTAYDFIKTNTIKNDSLGFRIQKENIIALPFS
jgi:hypothetical protein